MTIERTPATTPVSSGLTDLIEAERETAERVAAISARRGALAREALALQQQLATLVQAADATIAEAFADLIHTAREIREPDDTRGAATWPEVEALMVSCMSAMNSFRQVMAPVMDTAGQVISQMGPLLALTEGEIEQRAELLVAARTSALAAQAARYPEQ